VARRGTRYALPLVALVVSGYVAYRIATPQLAVANVSYRNGQQCYGGVTYSTGYLKQVIDFMKRAGNCAGGYIADSAYYRPLYYSNRNPAVYHLPLTYIIANNVTTNIDYCLSAEDAILYNGTGSLQYNVYLRNAIARSWYHRHKTAACGGVPDTACAAAFVLQNRLRYLVLTPGIKIDSMLAGRITAIFTDDPTGERFLVLQ
jgi:hypothetical protein